MLTSYEGLSLLIIAIVAPTLYLVYQMWKKNYSKKLEDIQASLDGLSLNTLVEKAKQENQAAADQAAAAETAGLEAAASEAARLAKARESAEEAAAEAARLLETTKAAETTGLEAAATEATRLAQATKDASEAAKRHPLDFCQFTGCNAQCPGAAHADA